MDKNSIQNFTPHVRDSLQNPSVTNVNIEQILADIGEGLYIVDTNRKIVYWNKGAEKITGFTAEEVVNSHCYDNILVHINEGGERLCGRLCPLAASIADGEKREVEAFLHHKRGHRKPVYIMTIPLRDNNGTITSCAELFIDLSSEKTLGFKIEELKRLAFYDRLTGLANRRYLEQNIEIMFSERQKTNLSFGILFFDIDKFKTFNDKFGHDNGDRVLRLIADTISSNTRPYDTYGRWGGEEFLGIIRNVNLHELTLVAEKLRILIANSMIKIAEEYLNITVSIGGTLVREKDDMLSLVKKADELMYESKNTGRNKVTVK